MLKHKILKDTLIMNAASLIGQLLGILQSLVLMRLLQPSKLGVWLGLGILIMYGNYVHLGLDYGLGIRLPYYRGREDAEREDQAQDSAYVAWTALSVLFGAGLAAYALLMPQPSALVRWGLLAIAAMVPLEQQSAFFGRWQTSSPIDFKLGSYIAVGRSLLTFVLMIPGAWFFGVPGVVGAAFLVSAATCGLWLANTPYHFRRRFSMPVLREMFVIGLPILVVSIAGVIIQTVDRVIIVTLLGAASLGLYGITGLGGNFLYGILSQAGNAMSPHIAAAMGRSGGDATQLESFLRRPTIAFAFASAFAIMMLAVLVPPFVMLVVPKYSAGIPAFYLFVPGFFFLGTILTANNILNMVLIERRRQRIVVYIQAAAIAVEAGCAIGFIQLGWGIAGVALASTLSYMVYGLSILGFATYYVMDQPARRVAFLAQVFLPLASSAAVAALVIWGGDLLIPNLVLRTVVEAAVASAAGLALLSWANASLGIRREMEPLVAVIATRFRPLVPPWLRRTILSAPDA